MTTSQINSALRTADNAEKALLDEADALDLLTLASAVRTMAKDFPACLGRGETSPRPVLPAQEAPCPATNPPAFAEQIKNWNMASIICFLRCQAMDFRHGSPPHLKNIQPVDLNALGEVFNALGDRLLELTLATTPAPSAAHTKGPAQ